MATLLIVANGKRTAQAACPYCGIRLGVQHNESEGMLLMLPLENNLTCPACQGKVDLSTDVTYELTKAEDDQ